MLTRFAPAPTGALHLGHVLNAIYVWDLPVPTARRCCSGSRTTIGSGAVRNTRPAFSTTSIGWGSCPTYIRPQIIGPAGVAGRQSDRVEIYREAVAMLRAKGLLYACDCTRRTLSGRYDGRCRTRGLPLSDGYGWRVVVDAGVEAFDDLVLGRQAQDPSDQCGDVLIRDRRGNWTYQFAVSVDDWQQKIDLVIRGADLLDSTGRQIRLGRMLGREHPARYAHHPLIMKSPDQKLSKSDGDTGVRDLRGRGWTPADVLAAARSSISAAAPGAVPHRR